MGAGLANIGIRGEQGKAGHRSAGSRHGQRVVLGFGGLNSLPRAAVGTEEEEGKKEAKENRQRFISLESLTQKC